MKKYLPLLCWLAIHNASALQFGPPVQADSGQTLDDIALIVNNTAISRRTLAAELDLARRVIGAPADAPPALVTERAMDQVIMKHLLDDLLARANIQITPEEIQRGLALIARQNGIGEAELLRRVKQDTGLDETAYRAQLAEDLAQEKLKQALIADTIRISEEAIDDQITQIVREQGSTIHVQDLLIRVPEGDPKERGQAVKDSIAAVSAAVAASHDLRDAANRVPGARFADLGVINIGQIPPNFARAVVTLAPGEMVPQPVIDSDGMHFLKVVSKTAGGDATVIPEGKVRHILLRSQSALDDKTQEENIRRLHAQLSAGANFAELARRHSHDQASAVKGGELGWISADQVAPEFARAMLATPPGTLSAPFKSSFGWHILIVDELRNVDRSEEKLRERIRDSLYNKAVEEAWQQKLLELRENAYIVIK
ncbi:MAG: peptidylprolyl isomerase [Cardiobacteriaceae bacterium]|nr:peptidylprolyl isomerase [Cardiobacteriaceae bacterium]